MNCFSKVGSFVASLLRICKGIFLIKMAQLTFLYV